MNMRLKNILSWTIIVALVLAGIYFFGLAPGDEHSIVKESTIDHRIETINEDDNGYDITAHYPVFTGLNKEIVDKINETSANFIKGEIYAFKEDIGGPNPLDDGSKSVFNADTSITLETSDLVSIRYNISAYVSGAAHPFNYVKGLSLNLKNGTELSLEDLFTDNYLDRFSDISRSQLLQKRANQQGGGTDQQQEQWIREGTAPKFENFSSFSLTANEIIFHFNPYQVAPYAEGILDVAIPYEDIQGLIKTGSPIESMLSS